MTITDEISFLMNVVSTILTVISFGFSCWAFVSAKKAQKYKEDIIHVKESIDLDKLCCRFLIESTNFQNKTRKYDWSKGIDTALVISPFTEILKSFASFYHLFKDQQKLRKKVQRLYIIVEVYETAKKQEKQECNNLVFEIGEILQEQVKECTKHIIQNNQ